MNPISLAIDAAAQNLVKRADSFFSTVTHLGEKGRDVMTSYKIQPMERMSSQELRWFYRDNLYAERHVDQAVEDALRHGWRVDGADQRALEDQYRRFAVAQKLGEAMQLARRDGNAYLWLLVNESAQDEPLRLERSPELLSIIVVEKDERSIEKYDEDLTSPTYKKPLIYNFTPQAGGQSYRVHASRVIELKGKNLLSLTDRLANDGDDSVLHSAREQLKRWNILEQSTGHLVNEFKVSVLKTARDKAQTNDNVAAVKEMNRLKRIATFKNILNLVNIGVDEEFEQRSVSVTGFKELVTPLVWGLSAATRQPLVKLLGMPPAGLSSDDEASARSWDEVVGGLQDRQLGPALERIHEVFFACWNVPVQATPGWSILWTGREHANDTAPVAETSGTTVPSTGA